MKAYFPFLTVLYSVFLLHAEEELDSPLSEEGSQPEEIALLEPTLFQTPPSLEEIEIPSSKFFQPQKNTFLAVGLSSFIPGLGHVYLGDYKTAGSIFGSWTGLCGGVVANQALDSPKGLKVLTLSTMLNTWQYSIYAAYRDARSYNDQGGYRYKMPEDSFADLAKAPFQWSILKKPEVWGGLLGALTLAVGVSYLSNHVQVNFTSKVAYPLHAFPVGIGEECLFRGFWQSSLSEYLTPVGGIALSSLAFGAAHISNAKGMRSKEKRNYYSFGIPFITLSGAYFGWLTYKNSSLKESVAVHSWYDFTLFLTGVLSQSAIIRMPSCTISIPF